MKPGPDEHPVKEVTSMPNRNNANAKAVGGLKIGALKLERETLRELDAGELQQAQGGPGATRKCLTWGCFTRGCGGPRHQG
jgi:hypothetical protein